MSALRPHRMILVALVLPIVAACHEGRVVDPTPAPPEEITLRVGEHRFLARQGVEVGFERVASDSRCPARVVCVWEGEASLELWVRRIAGSRESVGISMPGSQPSSVETADHRISALALAPYPQEPGRIPESTYRLKLRVESLRR